MGWYQFCSTHCSKWRTIGHTQTPLHKARKYMNYLRHGRYVHDDRHDCIVRSHPCECGDCLQGAQLDSPDPDQALHDDENRWFNTRCHLPRVPVQKFGCEFPHPAPQTSTAAPEGTDAKSVNSDDDVDGGVGEMQCTAHGCDAFTRDFCGRYSPHASLKGVGPCRQPVCGAHGVCPFHHAQEKEFLIQAKYWKRVLVPPRTRKRVLAPGDTPAIKNPCAREGCYFFVYQDHRHHNTAYCRNDIYCSRACALVDEHGDIFGMHLKCSNPECHLVSNREYCSVGCHDMHANIEKTQEREREYWRERHIIDAARAATMCTTNSCQQRKSPSQLRNPNGLCTNCHATQHKDRMRDGHGPCAAHWLCVQQPTRQCSFGALHQDDSTVDHYVPPAHVMTCNRPVCGRINHRFCERHQSGPRVLQCQSRRCDQPSI